MWATSTIPSKADEQASRRDSLRRIAKSARAAGTERRKITPPMVSSSKTRAAARSRTKRYANVPLSENTERLLLGVERNFAARDMPVLREHLPANDIVPWGHAIELRGDGIRGLLIFDLDLMLLSVQAHPRQLGALGVNADIKSQLRGDGVPANDLV